MDWAIKVYCLFHRLAKMILRRENRRLFKMVNVTENDLSFNTKVKVAGPYINDIGINTIKDLDKKYVYPVENIVSISGNKHLKESYQNGEKKRISFGLSTENALSSWQSFILSSRIPEGYRDAGLHYTGYILDAVNDWCLPTWIWTNAAIVRLHCTLDNIAEAKKIGDILLEKQLECGGWIVRNDYSHQGALPILAPNDSAYIANNACLEVYRKTKDEVYLTAAVKCADWIMESARPDGLVWSGYDMKSAKWLKKHIIVDTGFTAGLFANLYEFTGKKVYKDFLEKFVHSFIDLFFDTSKGLFATSLDSTNSHYGGYFARGQAWALEGLIPAYRVLGTEKVHKTINSTVGSLIRIQLNAGGWSYNFAKPLLGIDCKGVTVIAKSLMEWYKIEPSSKTLNSAKMAWHWSKDHTAINGDCKGGIFSFCMEGAVVHNFYTKTAFVYSSAYAIELQRALGV